MKQREWHTDWHWTLAYRLGLCCRWRVSTGRGYEWWYRFRWSP